MRLKRSRIKQYFLRKMIPQKDSEGNAYTGYGEAVSWMGEVWPAGGKLQQEMYGLRLPYIRNIRIQGNYKIETDEKGITHYIFSDGLDIAEGDGLCLHVDKDSKPDYKIISIRPYRFLKLEAERL